MTPRVVVLILSYNGKYLLEDSVSTYLSNDYESFEVCVIDNGSTDDTKSYVEEKFPSVHVLRTAVNLKYSGGFNFGLQYAFRERNADYVLITNNDVKVDSSVIKELVKVAELDALNGFVTGKVYYFDHPKILQTVGKKYDPILWNGGHIGGREEDAGQYDEVAERFFADDIFTLVRRSLYEKVGGYDTEFQFQGEEYDWQARAKQAGFRIMYTPYAKIWHKESMTIGKSSPFKYYFDSRNPTIVQMKYRSPQEFKAYFWYHFKVRIVLPTIVSLKKLEFKRVAKIWQGFLSSIVWGIKNNKLTVRHII